MPINWNNVLSYDTVKIVKIKDWRLGFLHYFFMLAILLYVFIYAVWWQQGYISKEEPDGGYRFTLREPRNLLDANEYDYCNASSSTVNGFNTLRCLYMSGSDALFPAGSSSTPFFTTRTKITTRNDPAPAECAVPTDKSCIMTDSTPNVTTSRFYVAGIEDYTVFLEHAVYGLTNDVSKRNLDMKGELYKDGKKYQVLDSNRTGDILTVRELLNLADIESLDVASGVTGSAQTLRYDGVMLIMVIEYYNRVSKPLEFKYRISLKKVTGVDTARFDATSANRAQNRHGIEILVIQTGLIGKFSFPALLSAIIGGAVLTGVSTTIVDLLATKILPEKKAYNDNKFQETDVIKRKGTLKKKEKDVELNGLPETSTA